MPISKTKYFNVKQNEVAKVAKAMGHPARIAILDFLMERKSCVCNEIVTQLPLAQATISQHLKVLKEAGLIKGDISPNKSCYCIDSEGWKMAKSIMEHFLGSYTDHYEDPCCE